MDQLGLTEELGLAVLRLIGPKFSARLLDYGVNRYRLLLSPACRHFVAPAGQCPDLRFEQIFYRGIASNCIAVEG